jgi:chromosome partitioning protein
MERIILDSLKKTSRLFSQIQKLSMDLPRDSAGVVQLFFGCKFSIVDVAEICQLSKDKSGAVISGFLTSVMSATGLIEDFQSRGFFKDIDTNRSMREVISWLIEDCGRPGSPGERVRDIIGTAIGIHTPFPPSDLTTAAFLKAGYESDMSYQRGSADKHSMRVLAIVNQKGGCGKTTVSINLASALALAGQRVLLVDMDPQSHCAVGLAVPEEQIEQSIYDVLISRSRNEPIKLTEILWQISDKLELAPASIDLSAFEQQMAGITEREGCLKEALEEVNDQYDYTIVDCPPAVGLLTFNALRAASDVIVPVETGYFALHSLSKQLETLSILCKRCSQQVDVKVLASMYDIRTKMAREILAELRDHFSDKMFKTVVNFNTRLKEASSFGQPISEYDSTSRGFKDFRALAEEVLASQVNQQRHEFVNSLAGQLESISATANELLEATKPAVKPPAATQVEKSQLVDISEKLSDYYGVNQMGDTVVFVTLYPRAQNVQLAGDFNNWQPAATPLEKVSASGKWQTKIKLPPGRYRYRLVVDGEWQQDPYNELTELTPFGEFNSVLEVR